MQKMTLKHTVRTRRFIHEHYDNCSLCGRKFIEWETTHLGYTMSHKLIYVGNCCSKQLKETIIRHKYQKRYYSIPEPKSILWRFMDFTKFVSLLKEKALYFSRADMFMDPFEGAKGLLKNKAKWDKQYLNFFIDAIKTAPGEKERERNDQNILMDAKRLLNQINSIGKNSIKNTYINCWHENPYESEAMWKLYTSNLNQGIAIKTSYHRLYCSLNKDPDIAIGRINYIDMSNKLTGVNDSFWFKRIAFEHEKEVRAIIYDHDSKVYGKLIPVNLNILIDKIYLSPTSEDWYKSLVDDVMKKYNFNKKIMISDIKATPFY